MELVDVLSLLLIPYRPYYKPITRHYESTYNVSQSIQVVVTILPPGCAHFLHALSLDIPVRGWLNEVMRSCLQYEDKTRRLGARADLACSSRGEVVGPWKDVRAEVRAVL